MPQGLLLQGQLAWWVSKEEAGWIPASLLSSLRTENSVFVSLSPHHLAQVLGRLGILRKCLLMTNDQVHVWCGPEVLLSRVMKCDT